MIDITTQVYLPNEEIKPNRVYLGLPAVVQCRSTEDVKLIEQKVYELRAILRDLSTEVH